MSETKVDIKKLAEIIALSVRDLTKEELEELTAILKDEYGLEPTVQVVEVAAEEVVEEKDSFNLVVTEINGKQLKLTKVWKAYSGLGLKETKALFDADLPIILKENLPKDEAERYKAELEEVGGTVEIQ